MHPAALLLNLIGLSVMYLAPLLGWFMLRRAQDRTANLWFGAALFYALGVSLFAFQAVISQRLAFEASLVGSWITLTIFKACLEHELGQAPRSLWRQVAASLAWAFSCHLIWGHGGRYWLLLWSLTWLGLFELHLLLLVRRLHLRVRSRGLIVLGSGLGVIALVNATRVGWSLLHGQPQNLMDFSPLSNLLLPMTFVCVMCYSMGYWGYLFEKVHQDKLAAIEASARAAERQKVADEYAGQLQRLVQQRDHMVLVNSRFAALNTLAVFNAGIVHEISQPLQSILSSVEMLSLELRATSRQDLANQSDDIARMTLKISHVLESLRRLMQATPPETERVPIQDLFGDCRSIIASECQKRGVALHWDMPLDDEMGSVVINRVLMERVLLNLASNALESFAPMPPSAARKPGIRIRVHKAVEADQEVVRVAVQDNGVGLKDIPGGLFAEPSSKPTGLGVGLQFVQAILAHWRGQVDIQSQTEGADTGTTVTLVLPLAVA